MTQIKVLRQAFLTKLAGSIGANLPRYKRETPWLQEFAAGTKWELPTQLTPVGSFALLNPTESDLKDADNAVRLHKALPTLTPIQARDPRLWTRLAHVEFWTYMRARWPLEKQKDDIARAERVIRGRYFVARNESRALLRNGIARLWWSAHLALDPGRENPYELVPVLFSSLDVTQQILERNIGRAPSVVRAFLTFLQSNPEILEGGDANRAQIRRLAKFLNLTGGVCVLDCLTESAVLDLLQKEHSRTAAAA